MALLLRKKPPFPFLCSISKSSNAINLLGFSSSASEIENPPPNSNVMREYLINSCGFSPEKAATASKPISKVTSLLKADSVRHFLKHHGFTDPEIRTLISGYPAILCGDVDRDMEPNLRALREYYPGFPEHELRTLIARNPRALQGSSAIPRLEFWRTILDGDKKRVFRAFARNPGIINLDIDKGVSAKIAVLKEYSLSQTGIGNLFANGNGFMRMSIEVIESSLKRVQELGFVRGSPMFVFALSTLKSLANDTLKAKMELYRSFGWSEEELISALQKFPRIVRFSEENIRAKMAFLVERAQCTQRYIALNPCLMGYSLEKRLIPRHHVMKILRSNGLVRREWGLNRLAALSEESFFEEICFCHTRINHRCCSRLILLLAQGKICFRYWIHREKVETEYHIAKFVDSRSSGRK